MPLDTYGTQPPSANNPIAQYIEPDGYVNKGRFLEDARKKIFGDFDPQSSYKKAMDRLPEIRARMFKEQVGKNWFQQSQIDWNKMQNGGKMNQLQQEYWAKYVGDYQKETQRRIEKEQAQRKAVYDQQEKMFDYGANQYETRKAQAKESQERIEKERKFLLEKALPAAARSLTTPEDYPQKYAEFMRTYGTTPGISAMLRQGVPTQFNQQWADRTVQAQTTIEQQRKANESKSGKILQKQDRELQEDLMDSSGKVIHKMGTDYIVSISEDGSEVAGSRVFKDKSPKVDSVQMYDEKTGELVQTLDVNRGDRIDIPEGLTTSKPAERSAQNYLLKSGETVISYDKGKTFVGSKSENINMPYDAVKVTPSMSEVQMLRSQERAKNELKKPAGDESEKESALSTIETKSGVGPYSMLSAAIDNVAGGLGVDAIFGREGFFPETQKSRQMLRTIKQVGKSALMNSSRGAIWEQQRIDDLFPDPSKVFVNPATEAKKFVTVRKVLASEREFNNQAIQMSTDPKEISALNKSNLEIDRLLALIGTGKDTSKPREVSRISSDEEFDALPSGARFIGPDGKTRRKP